MVDIVRFLETAAEKYDDIVEFNTDSIFNGPAPEPIVAFVIGGVCSVMGFFMWLRRVGLFKKKMKDRNIPMEWNLLFRAYISCALDLDEPFYAIISFAALSFLFLAGLQLDYSRTLIAMGVTYTLSALAEVTRILLAFRYTPSLKTLVVEGEILEFQMRTIKAELSPSSVYEDIGRGNTIVVMVFFTQILLIMMVCADMATNDTINCLDGTKNCPVVGTRGSWGFYVTGIFMACVFQLGPKTKYGESEQNAAYWLKLLLTTKEKGAKVTWNDPVKNKTYERLLSSGDWRIWARFFMSFLINGIGYHILVHALPLQGAQQSSFTSFVLRSVGMIYLVDLDDTPGYKLTVVLPPVEPTSGGEPTTKRLSLFPNKVEHAPATAPTTPVVTTPATTTNTTVVSGGGSGGSGDATLDEISRATQEIIEEAKRKLDALACGEIVASATTYKATSPNLLLGVYVSSTTVGGGQSPEQNEQPGDQGLDQQQQQLQQQQPLDEGQQEQLVPKADSAALRLAIPSGYSDDENDNGEAVDA